MAMQKIKSPQNPNRMSQTRKNNHDMKQLMTSTKNIKRLSEPPFWELEMESVTS